MKLFGRGKESSREPSPDRASVGETSQGGDKPRRNLKSRVGDKNRWYWKFAQQRLPGWAPILTGNGVVLYFLGTMLVCLAFGLPILIGSINVKEYSVRYDDAGPFSGQSRLQRVDTLAATGGAGVPLSVSLTVVKRMEPPIYVFFEVKKYYQNHKRYVRSRNDKQMGSVTSTTAGSSCAPEQYVNGSGNGALPADGNIDPCGLIAWSFFNDTYSLTRASGSAVNVDETDLAWSFDRNHLYGAVTPVNYNIYPDQRGGNTSSTVLNKNEHLMVWLRPGAKPDIRKLWGKINSPIAAGTVLNVAVQNRYDTYHWGGAKSLILSTNSWVGGKNLFLGVVYLVVAGLALIAALAFLICYHLGAIRRRNFGDLNELSWNRKAQ